MNWTSCPHRRGFTQIEALVAAALLAISLMGLCQLWTFALRVTIDSDDVAVAYNLARQATEQVRETGFYNTSEGSSTTYYDVQQNSVSAGAASCRYQVSLSVTSTTTVPGSNPVQPGNDALRTVVITVTSKSTGQILVQTGTYLARSGI